jgi:hypothetical protein
LARDEDTKMCLGCSGEKARERGKSYFPTEKNPTGLILTLFSYLRLSSYHSLSRKAEGNGPLKP